MIGILNGVSSDSQQLQDYLDENFRKVYDYFTNEKHSLLLQQRGEIDRFILFKLHTFRGLNFSNNLYLSFLTLLLDISERFELRSAFQAIYDILHNQNFNFGKRLNASALYLIGINTSNDYLNRFENIYSNLQAAFETEEDTEKKVLTTIINYYGQVIYNFEFNPGAAIDLKNKILNKISIAPHSFLNHALINLVLSVPIAPHDEAFLKIHEYVDSFLGRDIFRLFSDDTLLIEEGTQYSSALSTISTNFETIRALNRELYFPMANDSIFHSLQRGVKILEDENQLFAYMHSYGNMHNAKLVSAFELLPPVFFLTEIRIIDWGCGQAMATISFLDYLKRQSLYQDIRHITLVEPSEIALKRASLHLNKYTGGNNFSTLNKDLDSIVPGDLVNSIATPKLHLFSNILDIDLFSLTDLLEEITASFAGENYFVCVSPYINDLKTSRIDLFVSYFDDFDGYELIGSIDNRAGTWLNSWSRVIRVFKVHL